MEWMADIEGDAVAIYRRAKLDADRPVPIGRIVWELLGTKIQSAPLISTREATVGTSEGKTVIAVANRIARPRARWLAAHELAHWWYDLIGYRGEDIEERCDALGAAIICPRPAWLALRRRVEGDVHELARRLATTQSLALLRRGECEGTPAALVQPRRVVVRGWDFAWPAEEVVRKVARAGHPELRRVTITDEGKRVGLMAA
jgi:hypothetical protein